jgi:3-isopropylmalate dehydrogenase
MLLETSFGLLKEAKAIRNAVEQAMEDGILTIDIRREKPNSTTEVGDYVANLVAKSVSVVA